MPETIQTKRCPRCKQTFPATLEYFHKDKTKKDGLKTYCKQCATQIVTQYAQQHRAEK